MDGAASFVISEASLTDILAFCIAQAGLILIMESKKNVLILAQISAIQQIEMLQP